MLIKNKANAIITLKANGFNTPVFNIINKFTPIEEWKNWMEGKEPIHIRTSDISDTFNLPFYHSLSTKESYPKIIDLLNQDYTVIIGGYIMPSDTISAGTVYLVTNGNDIVAKIDLARGSVTTRKVTHEGIIDLSTNIKISSINGISVPSSIENIANNIVYDLGKIPKLHRFINHLFEVSYCNRPMGTLVKEPIYWDVRRC